MSSIGLPLPIGTASSSTKLNADLGKVYWAAGEAYRLCRSLSAITAAASRVVVSAVTAGTRTWSVSTTTVALNSLVAGVIPVGQLGSNGSTGLLAGDYFLAVVSGDTSVFTITASTAIGSGLVTTTTAGSADPVSATFAATTPGSVFAVLTATSVAGVSTVRVVNLI